MRLREHPDPADFLAAAAPLLAADEPRHNLGFGIVSTLITSPGTYPVYHLWTVDEGNGPVAAAAMTPPFNLWVAQPKDATALPFLADELALRGIALPGVVAARPEAEEFTVAWRQVTGARPRLRFAQGIYQATAPRAPEPGNGRMRDATRRDRELLIAWMQAFVVEALGDEAPHDDIDENVDRRLERRGGGLVIWDDEGAPVSFAGYGAETPNGVRIGPVYTPPELRRRGYATALAAELSRRLIDGGRRYCFLYTNLANPTANRIYQSIGFELVCESAEYVFEAS